MGDYLIRGIDETGNIRIFVATTSEMVEKARQTHNTSATATAAMGRTMTAAAMMGAMMKNERDRMTLTINGGGPLGKIVMVANNAGRIKGYVDNPSADAESKYPGKLDVGAIVGNDGYVSVNMDLGLREPYVGQSKLVSGEIAEDIAAYYALSEQQPSAVALGVLVEKDLSVKAAGGFIIQLLPGVEEEDIVKIEESLGQVPAISNLIGQGLSPEEIMEVVLKDFKMELIAREELDYTCDCSLERVKTALASLNSDEIRAMIDEDQGAEVVCHFCNTKYQLSKEDLEKIIVDK